MLSEKQLAANRANAQRSTGPRTEEGKRRSSLNARRHNLTGQVTAMPEEDRIAHNAFSEALIKSMAPEGALELQLAQRIATDSWRLNRSSAIEDNIFALRLFDHSGDIDVEHPELHAALTAARTFTREAKSIQLLTLYEQRINRSLQKNLALLQQLQATRKAERKAETQQPRELASPVKSNNLPEQPAENGFIFSNEQRPCVIDPAHPSRRRDLADDLTEDLVQARLKWHWRPKPQYDSVNYLQRGFLIHMIRTILTLTFSGALCTAFGQTPCENLKSLNLPNVTFTKIESVPEGPFVPPTGPGAAQAAAAGAPVGRGGRGGGPAAPALILRAHCRAVMVLAPSSDSHIEMELWLPEAADWNGKFQAQGNGGWAGAITFPAMAQALKEGYATASNDTGHTGGDPAFGLGHTEKLVDFAWRANHEMTVQSKAIISAYYGKASKLNYWNGCSTGGRQGLMEAQKFPADFDAVIAGAPANFQTHLHAWDMNVATTAIKDGQMFMTPGKLATLNKAVLAQCDAMDGVKDGLLNDPRKCKFDPAALLCKGPDSDACLTAKQVEGAKLVYAAAKKKNGDFIFPGKEPGSELVWTQLNPAKTPISLILGTFQVATYQDANWDWHNYDLDRDVAAADEKFGYVNAPYDLSAFKARGGKLLLYHGWNDTAISPENTINYYQNVLQKMGPKQDSWMRLYMVPGMNHCQGGVGPDQFNKMGVVERWRESNTAPEQILAEHVTGATVDMTRPLCPYPQVATYKGTGSTNDAASFTCKAPAL